MSLASRIAVLAAAVVALTGCALPAADGGASTATSTSPTPAPTGLAVAPETHASSYDRAAFGQRWKDTDRNGCGQRDDVLARDLTGVQRRGRCVVVAGYLTDPYTGQEVAFTKEHASGVQIDHVVALADAWRSGAWAWPSEQRESFANDLDELQAASAASNNSKSDHDAATWSPTKPALACTWARKVVAIKVRWRLAADQAEASALTAMISRCPA